MAYSIAIALIKFLFLKLEVLLREIIFLFSNIFLNFLLIFRPFWPLGVRLSHLEANSALVIYGNYGTNKTSTVHMWSEHIIPIDYLVNNSIKA